MSHMDPGIIIGLVIGALICGVIGGLIGSYKARGKDGFFWGCFLGPIGWIIVALLPDERPRCRSCKAPLPSSKPRTCPSCGAALVRKHTRAVVDPVEQWEARQRPPGAQ